MRSDARKRLHPEPLPHHDPAVVELIRAAKAEALTLAADAIERTRSTKGIAAAALDPGKAYAVDMLRDRAHELLAGGHVTAGDSLPPAGRERLGVPPASAEVTS